MDLLQGYDSEAEASEDETEKPQKETKISLPEEAPVALPAEAAPVVKKAPKQSLLPSASEMFSSVSGASFLAKKPVSETPTIQAPPKVAEPAVSAPVVRAPAVLVPPQLSRGANVTTEASALWSTETGKAGKKRPESFNTKEKRKREQGKTSREGSYVEEEKRILRNLGD